MSTNQKPKCKKIRSVHLHPRSRVNLRKKRGSYPFIDDLIERVKSFLPKRANGSPMIGPIVDLLGQKPSTIYDWMNYRICNPSGEDTLKLLAWLWHKRIRSQEELLEKVWKSLSEE